MKFSWHYFLCVLGKELFLTDHTLDDSDVKFLDDGGKLFMRWDARLEQMIECSAGWECSYVYLCAFIDCFVRISSRSSQQIVVLMINNQESCKTVL